MYLSLYYSLSSFDSVFQALAVFLSVSQTASRTLSISFLNLSGYSILPDSGSETFQSAFRILSAEVSQTSFNLLICFSVIDSKNFSLRLSDP